MPTVLITYGYEKEKINGNKIINGIFQIIEKIGQGSFWSVFKVERNVTNDLIEDKKYYVFKEGQLSFIIQNDEFTTERILNDENDFKIENYNENDFNNENYIDEIYSDKVIQNGNLKI